MEHRFQLVAGHLALDFVNTLDNRYGTKSILELLPTYESFLAFARQSGMLTLPQARMLMETVTEREATRALKDVIDLREALYFIFRSVAIGEQPDESDLRTFNRFLLDASAQVPIVWNKHGFVRALRNLAESAKGPLLPIVEAATDLLLSPGRHLVRECNNETCRWLILDGSKNHTRRWCDMRVCGNRSKAQRFHARQRRKKTL